ncbi:MAG: LysM repeat protein [Parvicellaceae bacterium]|jgi:LysM repeat protein
MVFGQDKRQIIDTLINGNDTIYLFEDKTWEYSHALNFTGIMSPEIAAKIEGTNLKVDWQNEVTFNYDNDMSILNDSIWLCTTDSNYNTFCLPSEAPMTSSFKMRGKRFHYGVDMDLETGDTVRSAFDGIVRYAKFNGAGFGFLAIVRHYNGLETYYAHLSRLDAKINQRVKAGDVLGLGGSTGRSTGAHLHFEVRFFHSPIDPEEIINFKTGTLKTENLIVHKGLFDYRKIDGSKKRFVTAKNKTPEQVAKEAKEAKEHKWHTIKKGDSLYAMALHYRTSVDKICSLNSISRKKILDVGEKIRVR